MQKLFCHQLIASCFLCLLAEFDLSSIAEDSINSDAAWSTHQERPKPDDVKETKELLVSLEQFLGTIDCVNSFDCDDGGLHDDNYHGQVMPGNSYRLLLKFYHDPVNFRPGLHSSFCPVSFKLINY